MLLGPKYPFNPRDLFNLQRRTDTLTGREFTKRMDIRRHGEIGAENKKIARASRKMTNEQLKEYRWKVADDDDNVHEDLLAPRYSSY
jgi:hypothetical protein